MKGRTSFDLWSNEALCLEAMTHGKSFPSVAAVKRNSSTLLLTITVTAHHKYVKQQQKISS